MIFGGCDLGSTTGKAVVIIDDKIILGNIVMATSKPGEQITDVKRIPCLRTMLNDCWDD